MRMRKNGPARLSSLVFAAALGASIMAPAATGQEADWKTVELGPGVFVFSYGAYNTLFLVEEDGVVAFDPISPDAARVLAQEIKTKAPGLPLTAIVYSHHHADHASGGAVLRAIFGGRSPIIAHENALPPIQQAGDPAFPPPDLTFSRRLSLRPGTRHILLIYLGPSHTNSMIVALLPQARVAFAVDFVANDRVGYRDLSSHVFPEFFKAIEALDGLAFDRIVFGHGPPGDRGSVKRQIGYYAALREAVQEAVDAGWSEDEAAERVRLDDYADWVGYDEWFALNVRGVYRWLAEEG